MSTKKYVSLSKLSTFLDNLRNIFAAKQHKHDDSYDSKGSADKAYEKAQLYIDTVASGKSDASHNHDNKYDSKGSASDALASANEYTNTKTSGLASTTVVDNKISNHNTNTSTHNDIRELITGLTNRLNTLANSDDTTLDQMNEVVAYIKNNKSLIDGITTSKVNVSDIINNLTTNVTNKPLSAAQGVVIKGLIDDLQIELDSHTHTIADVSGLQSALDGKAAKTNFDNHTADTTAHMTSTQKTQLSTAYNHSQAAHAPSNAQANQNAFSNIAVSGQTTVAADTTTDTVTFAGSNVSITTNATNDTVTFSVANGSTSAKGVVQLTNSTSSTSTTTAATPNSVKSAYDKADSAYTLASGHNHSLGENPTITADTPAQWKSLDTGYAYINKGSNASYPMTYPKTEDGTESTFGLLINLVLGNLVNQEWHVLNSNHRVYYRAGNADGWYGGTDCWVQSFNMNMTLPVENLDTTATKTELDYVHGVTSAIQTQLDDKAAKSHVSDTTKHITSTERTNWNAAKTHADSAHAPSNAQPNQNAFSNIAVSGQTTVAADAVTDTITFAGSNVSITTDATNDKITFSVADGTTSAKGIVKLTNSTSSTSTTTAATPSSVKSAYDLANTAKTNAATAQTRADNAYSLAEGKVDSLSDLGVTATAAELNKMDGVTATTAELNILDGITATTAELNYVDGVTSAIQTQLNGKQATISGAATTITGNNLTASRALISNSSGKVAVSAVTSTELGYLDGVSSNIQTQIDSIIDLSELGTALVAGNNLDDFTTPGIYACSTSSVAASITNSPPAVSGYKLVVMYTGNTSSPFQIAYCANGNVYSRGKTSSGWQYWRSNGIEYGTSLPANDKAFNGRVFYKKVSS